MQTKKYLLLLALFSVLSYAGYSQNDANAKLDTNKIGKSGQAQLNDYMNHTYPYPPKPRSKWELGFAVGNSVIFGDVNNKADLGGAITLRKALGHIFSYRIGYFGSYNQGYPSQYGRDFLNQRSYQNWTHRVGLDFIASLNTESNYRGNPKSNIYLLAGADLIASKVFFRAQGGQRGNHIDNAYKVFYNGYENGVGPQSYPNTQSGLITTFGKFKEPNSKRRGWALLGGASAGAGIAFKLSPKVNIGLEQRFTFTPYDYLDGFKTGGATDFYSFTSARVNLNIGSSAKKVEPLWWINPNNYVYNELNRPTHMIIPPPVLPDADGDGVTDQFDMEPNTPTGAPVDVRGVAKDTDGDGVPDYKDKELLTSSKCLPVNADGVGTCPEPACCTELRAKVKELEENGGGTNPGEPGSCPGLNNLPSVQFKAGSAKLSAAAMGILANAAVQIKGQPECRVKVVGHGTSDKRAQQLSWDRVKAVISYFVTKQSLSQSRFIFTYGAEGDANTVDLIGTKDTGPNTVPAPHPNLRNNR